MRLTESYDANSPPDLTGVTYYRYYTGDYNAASNPGVAHDVLCILDPTSVARLMKAESYTSYGQLDDLSDAQILAYADEYYTYDSANNVYQEYTGGGAAISTFSYATSTLPDDRNNWQTETIETRGDGTTVTTLENFAGQVVLQDTSDGTNHWVTYNVYDESGNLLDAYQPSAIAPWTNASPSWTIDSVTDVLTVNYNADTGLIDVNQYYTAADQTNYPVQDYSSGTPTSGGAAAGYLYRSGVQEGSSGAVDWQSAVNYVSDTVNGTTVYYTYQSAKYQDDPGSTFTFGQGFDPATPVRKSRLATTSSTLRGAASPARSSRARRPSCRSYPPPSTAPAQPIAAPTSVIRWARSSGRGTPTGP